MLSVHANRCRGNRTVLMDAVVLGVSKGEEDVVIDSEPGDVET